MALTGNLEIFPMPEVLRMLTRSKKSGCLRVDTGSVDGRVYLEDGSVTFANTEDDERFRSALVNAGLVDPERLRSVVGTDAPLADALADGVDDSSLSDFVREQIVESLYRIRRPGDGDFEFVVDLAPRFRTGQSFDAELVVTESDRRASEWADILSVIEDLDTPLRMVRALPDDNSVTVAAPTWRVLAGLEGGTSVRRLSEKTGVSEFRAARELSGLIRGDLVEVVESTPVDDGYRAPVIEQTPVAEPAWDEVEDDEGAESTWAEPTGVDEPPVEETAEVENAEEEPADSGAWFAEATGEADDWQSDTPTDDTEDGDDAGSDGGWWAATMDAPSEEAEVHEDDTDGFLESVFAQLDDVPDEGDEEHDDETGFSMGLLRRRRMGTAARDITND